LRAAHLLLVEQEIELPASARGVRADRDDASCHASNPSTIGQLMNTFAT
jgi:hypothetical protein